MQGITGITPEAHEVGFSPEIILIGNIIVAKGTASNFPRLSESAVALHIAQRCKGGQLVEVMS